MIRVDFHCHTYHSEDSLAKIEDLLKACRRKGVDRLVITDHNSIAGALEAKHMDPERIIVGEEIWTTGGELLACFVREEVPYGLAPLEAIQCLREQGAFISVSHPLDALRGWDLKSLMEILPHVDALETFNARCMLPRYNRQAQNLARQHNLPGTSGSDAHTPSEIGAATLILEEFTNAEELRQVIRRAIPKNRLSGPWVHFASRRAVKLKKQLAALESSG